MLFYGKLHDDPLTSVIDATSNLWRDVDIRPGGFPGDLDPVWEGGGGGLGPAGTAGEKLRWNIIFKLYELVMRNSRGFVNLTSTEGCAGSWSESGSSCPQHFPRKKPLVEAESGGRSWWVLDEEPPEARPCVHSWESGPARRREQHRKIKLSSALLTPAGEENSVKIVRDSVIRQLALCLA